MTSDIIKIDFISLRILDSLFPISSKCINANPMFQYAAIRIKFQLKLNFTLSKRWNHWKDVSTCSRSNAY